MKIAALQFKPEFGDIDGNIRRILESCDGVRADLMVLPELCTTGYQFRDEKELRSLARPAAGAWSHGMKELAGMLGGYVVAGFAEKSSGQLYNSAALIGADGVRGIYRKIHLYSAEKKIFQPGNLGFRVFDAGGVSVGMMICFDWIFPESARCLALEGALIIAHSANLVLRYCQDAMVTRAVENRVFTITANRIGDEERLKGQKYSFTGSSRMVGPDGSILADGPADAPAVLTAEIDSLAAGDKHITFLNHLFEDRREEEYGLLVDSKTIDASVDKQ